MADDGIRRPSKSKRILGWLAVIVAICLLAVILIPIASNDRLLSPLSPPIPNAADSSNILPPVQPFGLFFVQPGSLKLVRVQRELRLHKDTLQRLKQIVNQLCKASPDPFLNVIPNGTFLYEVYVDSQSTAYLDFSSHLTDAHIGGTTAELLTLTAILKTVEVNFSEEIQKVQILIEGQEFRTIAGHVDISSPLSLPKQSSNAVE